VPATRRPELTRTLLALGIVAGAAIWFLAHWLGEPAQLGAAPVVRADSQPLATEPPPAPPAPVPAESIVPERQVEGLRVFVTDASGASVSDRPIAIRAFGSWTSLVRERTDANGLCTIAGLEGRIEQLRRPGASEPPLVIGLDEPFLPSTRHLLRPGATIPQQLLLGVPATAPLTIRLVDSEGRRVRERAAAFLRETAASLSSPVDPMSYAEIDLVEGEGTLPAVEAGVELEIVVAGAPQGGGKKTWVTSTSETTVEVPVTTRNALLVARAVDSERRPLRDRMLGAPDARLMRTDGEGRFRALVKPRTVLDGDPDSGRLEVWASEVAFFVAAPEPPLREVGWASVALGEEFSVGRHDIGDLVFHEGVLAVSGRVVDEEGRALDGSSVRVRLTGSRRPRRDVAPLATDADGRFELRVQETWDALTLTVERTGRIGWTAPTLAAVPFGTTDLVVTLVPRPTLTGSLQLPAGADPASLRIRFGDLRPDGDADPALANRLSVLLSSKSAPGAAAAAAGRPGASIAPDASFRLEGVAFSSILVEIFGTADVVPLKRIELASVGVEPLQAPPELQQIDLRDRLRIVAAKVVEADGTPVRGASILRRLADGSSDVDSRIGTTDADGCVALGTQDFSLDLRASARGRGSQLVEGVREQVTFTLPPPIRVDLEVDGASEAGLEPKWIRAFLEPIRVPDAERVFVTANEDGALSAEVPAPGSWRLLLFYSPPGHSLTLGTSTVDVRERDESQRIRSTVDRGYAREALEALSATR